MLVEEASAAQGPNLTPRRRVAMARRPNLVMERTLNLAAAWRPDSPNLNRLMSPNLD